MKAKISCWSSILIRIVIVEAKEDCLNYLYECLSIENDFEIAGLGRDGYEAVKLVDQHKPDIVLMDMNIPMGDGIKTASLIKYRSPQTLVIIRGEDGEGRVSSFFFNGISGYIDKSTNGTLLCQTIRAVYHGGRLISPEVVTQFKSIAVNLAGKIFTSRDDFNSVMMGGEKISKKKSLVASTEDLPHTISPSEIQIISFVGQGFTNKEIAEKLSLTEGTIRNYISSVLQKTGFRDRTQVAIYAVKAGL